MREKENENNKNTIARTIGSTTYLIGIHFSENAKETMEEKILRLISREMMTENEKSDIIGVPQMSRPA